MFALEKVLKLTFSSFNTNNYNIIKTNPSCYCCQRDHIGRKIFTPEKNFLTTSCGNTRDTFTYSFSFFFFQNNNNTEKQTLFSTNCQQKSCYGVKDGLKPKWHGLLVGDLASSNWKCRSRAHLLSFQTLMHSGQILKRLLNTNIILQLKYFGYSNIIRKLKGLNNFKNQGFFSLFCTGGCYEIFFNNADFSCHFGNF